MEENTSNKTKIAALAYLFGTSLFYGLLIVVQKIGLNSGLDPFSFTFSRSVFVVLLSLLFFSHELRPLGRLRRAEIGPPVALGVISAISIMFLFIGQDSTTAMNAGFLIRLTPLFVIPFIFIVFKERIHAHSVVYMFIMLIGAFFLITDGVLNGVYSGDLLIIAVASMIAFQNVFAKKIMSDVSVDIVILCRVCLSSLLLVIIIPLALDARVFSLTTTGLAFSVVAAVLYFFSVFFNYRAIHLVGPFITTVFFLSGSLFSAFFAYLLLGEVLSLLQWAGGGCILIGGLLLVRKKNVTINNDVDECENERGYRDGDE